MVRTLWDQAVVPRLLAVVKNSIRSLLPVSLSDLARELFDNGDGGRSNFVRNSVVSPTKTIPFSVRFSAESFDSVSFDV